LQRAKYIISYYKQENKQFEVKNELMGIQLTKAKREAEKAKALMRHMDNMVNILMNRCQEKGQGQEA